MANTSTTLSLTPVDPDVVFSSVKRSSKTGNLIREFINMNKPVVRINNIEKLYASANSGYAVIYKWLRRNSNVPVRVTMYQHKIYLIREDIESAMPWDKK